jgi:hypothetical protein
MTRKEQLNHLQAYQELLKDLQDQLSGPLAVSLEANDREVHLRRISELQSVLVQLKVSFSRMSPFAMDLSAEQTKVKKKLHGSIVRAVITSVRIMHQSLALFRQELDGHEARLKQEGIFVDFSVAQKQLALLEDVFKRLGSKKLYEQDQGLIQEQWDRCHRLQTKAAKALGELHASLKTQRGKKNE